MKAFLAFIKPFCGITSKYQNKNLFKLIFSLRPGSGREGLTYQIAISTSFDFMVNHIEQ